MTTEASEVRLTITKADLMAALIESGLSYEQPPEADTERVWVILLAEEQNDSDEDTAPRS